VLAAGLTAPPMVGCDASFIAADRFHSPENKTTPIPRNSPGPVAANLLPAVVRESWNAKQRRIGQSVSGSLGKRAFHFDHHLTPPTCRPEEARENQDLSSHSAGDSSSQVPRGTRKRVGGWAFGQGKEGCPRPSGKEIMR